MLTHKGTQTIETPRLILRRAQIEDAQRTIHLLGSCRILLINSCLHYARMIYCGMNGIIFSPVLSTTRAPTGNHRVPFPHGADCIPPLRGSQLPYKTPDFPQRSEQKYKAL